MIILNIAILDDNKSDRIQILDYISTYASLHKVEINAAEFENPNIFLDNFEKEKYDIIFLDVYLTSTDGISVAKQIREKDTDCLIIFSTCSEHHAISGYRVNAFDYLLKPYDFTYFDEVLSRALKTLKSMEKIQYIRVKEGRLFVNIPIDHIIYTDYSNHYIQIHTAARMIKSYIPFKDFSAMLANYPQFLCCYRNCIINMDKVNHIEERDFVMQNGDRVPIARAKHNELKQYYADYMFEQLTKEDNNFGAGTIHSSSHPG